MSSRAHAWHVSVGLCILYRYVYASERVFSTFYGELVIKVFETNAHCQSAR